tara:strand:+ start:248 stop:349 length:102 start_codon:yes stop_codon:yes gene_type:complete
MKFGLLFSPAATAAIVVPWFYVVTTLFLDLYVY